MRLPASRKYKFKIAALAAGLLALCGGGLATTACADGINGFLEYAYSTASSDVTSTTEGSSSTTGDSFRQRYYLTMDRTIYPNLRFNAGGLFEKTMNTTKTDDVEMDSESTRFTPRADLTLSNIFYNAGIGYSRRIDSSKTDGVAPPDSIIETMNGRLNFKPEGLPTLNLFYTRTNYFDENRTSRDTTTSAYSLSSTYKPLKNLDVGYLGQYTVQTDNLNNRESTSTNHNGRVAYSRQFLEGRASISGTYNVSMQSTENVKFVSSPLGTAVSFYKSIQSAPQLSDTPSLANTLADGLGTGSDPTYLIGRNLNPISTDYYHFVIDLSDSTTVTNTIFVTVNPVATDSKVELTTTQLSALANQFSCTIYAKIDVNSPWKLVTGPQAFSLNPNGTIGVLDNSFKVTFSDTTAQYFQVVIQPKVIESPPGVIGPVELYVTELKAFFERDDSTPTESTSHILNLGGRVRIYDPYDVNYEFFYTYSKSDTDFFSSSRYTVSNALRAQRRFNSIVSGSARVAREDSSDSKQSRTAYLYSASLQATPLPLLSHSLVYSGRTESTGSRTSSTNSVYLNNSASPYRGVDLSLSAGYSTSTAESGQKTDSLTVGMGASLVPNTKLSINMNYAASNTRQSGGVSSTPATTGHRGDLSLSYNPVRSIFLNASLGVFAETGRDTTTVQSYGGSWGILRDGSLQLNISYSESLNQANSQKNRTLGPSLRWNIRPGSHLDISYQMSNSQTDTQDADFTSLSVLLRIGF